MGEIIIDSLETNQRDHSIDYLRAFVIVLVVFMHSALAYASFSTYNPANWVLSSAPIVDSSKFAVVDPIVAYCDTFFMPLLFLVSGFFVMSGLKRYGSGEYLAHRMKRLGVPFLFGVLIFAPIAFMPSFLASGQESPAAYFFRFFTYDGWPIGPPWFLWVLLAFNGIIAFLYKIQPTILTGFNHVPKVGTIFLAAFLSFFIPRLVGSHHWWFSFGPLDLQPIRMGLYFTCLLIGIRISSAGGLAKSNWIRSWPVWLLAGFSGFLVYVFAGGTEYNVVSILITSMAFSVSCIGASLGFLGISGKFGKIRNVFLDSLSANSFCIYLTHYAFTIWIQYFLLFTVWAPYLKLMITFFGSLLFSWGTSCLLRRNHLIRSYL